MPKKYVFNYKSSTFRVFKGHFKKLKSKQEEGQMIVKKELLLWYGLDTRNWKPQFNSAVIDHEKKLAFIIEKLAEAEVVLIKEMLKTHQGRIAYWNTAYQTEYRVANESVAPVKVEIVAEGVRTFKIND